jgi:cell division protein FtsN
VQKDAEVLTEQMRAKGYPASLSDQGDGWYRVLIGPFKTESEAAEYQKRLQADGVKYMVRKR